jgi:dihydroorotate dehydrogenase
MYQNIKPLLFSLDPEKAHDLILGLMQAAGSLSPVQRLIRKMYYPKVMRSVAFAGLNFPNAVGLAAGFDKNATAWKGLSCLGFGHIELGTVTPRPQSGNPKPRLFRFPAETALINQMGFPGKGMDYVRSNIPSPGSSLERDRIILGINIGKNKDTPNQEAVKDYLVCLKTFYGRSDYCVINVSSPNTLGLRDLQGKDHLMMLLKQLVTERDKLQGESEKPFPLFVKLSPDLSDQELDDALEAICEIPADGVIVANTTIQRDGSLKSDLGIDGGLSGTPLKDLSTGMIRKIQRWTAGSLPIIGVGGISSPEDALEKLDAGARLVQVYSGLVFNGPGLIRELVEGLS